MVIHVYFSRSGRWVGSSLTRGGCLRLYLDVGQQLAGPDEKRSVAGWQLPQRLDLLLPAHRENDMSTPGLLACLVVGPSLCHCIRRSLCRMQTQDRLSLLDSAKWYGHTPLPGDCCQLVDVVELHELLDFGVKQLLMFLVQRLPLLVDLQRTCPPAW